MFFLFQAWWWKRVWKQLYKPWKWFLLKETTIPRLVYIDPLVKYESQQRQRFLSFGFSPEANNNIPSVFYNLASYQAVNYNHEVVSLFQSRVLIESTPQGNIIMLFDPVKLSFTYYSDSHISSYPLLNAVAMKYCRMFHSCDFFVDDHIRVSPLLSILKEHYYADNVLPPTVSLTPVEEDPDYEIIKSNAHLFKISKTGNGNGNKPLPHVNEKYRNRFLYLGRIRDFTPLQTISNRVETTQRILFPEQLSSSETPFSSCEMQIDWNKFKLREIFKSKLSVS